LVSNRAIVPGSVILTLHITDRMIVTAAIKEREETELVSDIQNSCYGGFKGICS
jgi:hypothetical protein